MVIQRLLNCFYVLKNWGTILQYELLTYGVHYFMWVCLNRCGLKVS